VEYVALMADVINAYFATLLWENPKGKGLLADLGKMG
jgi:hypothetical protein